MFCFEDAELFDEQLICHAGPGRPVQGPGADR